jgi:serine protease
MNQFIWLIFLTIVSAPHAFADKYIASSSIPIENQFIVVLNENNILGDKENNRLGNEGNKALLESLASQHAARLSRTYNNALKGGVMQMSEENAKALALHPMVKYVEQDGVIQLVVPPAPVLMTANQEYPTPSWGLDRIDQHTLPLNNTYIYDNKGIGVVAYVIDTGIYPNHNDFGGRASIGIDIVNDGNQGDCNGHGTHVAGIIGGTSYGVAKQVELVSVRVFNCSGTGTISGVIAGVDWVTGNATTPAVANMSLTNGASTALDAAVTNSINSGITYIVAAGNSALNACNYSPARIPSAITVGATSKTDDRPSWSNYGNCLDLFAPGVNIKSLWIGSQSATKIVSGTSMAAPHVTGVAALILEENPTANPENVLNTIIEKSTQNIITNPGLNSPNLLLFTDF